MGGQVFEAKRANAFLFDPNDLVIIGLDTEDGEEHPLYDERIKLPVDMAQVKNVIAFGVIEPIVVTKEGDKALVVEGRQRTRWARKASEILKERGEEPIMVPAIVRRGDESTLMGISIAANENRTDDNPMVRAFKVQRYLDRGRNVADAAVAFCVTTTSISNWLKLLDLCSKVQRAVAKEQISVSAAIELAGLPVAEQEAALDKLLAEGGKPTAEETRKERKERDGSGGGGSLKPKGRLIRKVLKHDRAKAVLGENGVNAIQWMLGELNVEEEWPELASLVDECSE